ncbi:high-potential iron-sulfur protein [Catalinimonas sp. 4WD22]|uniref:high-potential iron-sulfur protein n=1 Tax=Catalinimonas locisalis TaxID=3133978 RepID=UPI0031018EC0
MILEKCSRRTFIRQHIGLATTFISWGLILQNCTSKKSETEQNREITSANPCQELSEVSEEEIQKRENLGYVNESPIEENQCNNCNLYLPPGDKKCGGCMLFKGPVEAEGYCTYWAPVV